MSWRQRLRGWWRGAGDEGGLGQGFATDLLWLNRLRKARLRAVAWRAPTAAEARWWLGRSPFDRFGDACRAVVEVDGRRWAVLDRDWHGWPDPPQFVWFALAADGRVWAAADFDFWPKRWGELPQPRQS